MKKLKPSILLVAAGLLFLASFASCNDPEEKQPAPQPTLLEAFNTVFTNRPYPDNALDLTYCGSGLADKDAAFYTEDLQTATITLTNVIPGEKSTSFAVDMTRREGKSEVFNLTVARNSILTENGIAIKFGAMSIERGRLVVDIDDVVFPVNTLSNGAWWGLMDDPMHLLWIVKPGKYTTLSGAPLEIVEGENVNPGLIGMFGPMLGQMVLPGVLRDINFGRNGRIRAHYSAFDLGGETDWQLSPESNLCHYYMNGPTLMVKLNIAEIIEAASPGGIPLISRSEDGGFDLGGILDILEGIDAQLLERLLAQLSDWANHGIPVYMCDNTDGSLQLYLTTDQMGLLLQVVAALMPHMQGLIAGLIPEDMAGQYGELIESLLDVVAVYAANTEQFEIGINITPVANPLQ